MKKSVQICLIRAIRVLPTQNHNGHKVNEPGEKGFSRSRIECYICTVKRLIGILFIVVHVLAYTEFHQLLKIPFLIEHYQTHRQADPSLGFISFLEMHYIGPFIVDDDYQQDQQLPFRNVNISLMSTNVFKSDPPDIRIAPLTEIAIEFHCFDEINKPQIAAFDIFQPPRCA